MINKNLSKAAAESFVVYCLSRRGWWVINANSGVQNMPNVDLVAMKDKVNINIQVKARQDKKRVAFSGFREKGELFNSKDGPKANFLVSVLLNPNDIFSATCFILPIKEAERIGQKHRAQWSATLKRDGGTRKGFPIEIYKEKLGDYQNAWSLLDSNTS